MLVLFDSTVFLVEVKAGQLHASTRRGAPARTQQDYRKLIEAASAQASRAEQYIKHNTAPIFRIKGGKECILDKKRFREIRKVCVSLSPVDLFSTMVFQAAEAVGLPQDDYPWIVCLPDLMVISDLLQYPAQLLHYLSRLSLIHI